MKKSVIRIVPACAVLCVALPLAAAVGHRAVGSGTGSQGIYATDAYPGFEGLDDLPKPEKKETSWFLGVSRDTPAEQLAFAKAEVEAGNIRSARRACDALVREWPASPEAPKAQHMLAMIWSKYEEEYDEAFLELDYLLDFYPKDCPYEKLVAFQYKLANLMQKNRREWFGLSFTSLRTLRQHYEMIVRRAPGAEYVPEAMLKIADLREQDQHYEEAVQVYAALIAKYPVSSEARLAVYREAKARMWLVRRHAYNLARCRDTRGFLKQALARVPDLPEAEELKGWLKELEAYMAEDAYVRAKFYDSNQRTRHAAVASWERFLAEYPDSTYAETVRARIAELQGAAAAATSAREPVAAPLPAPEPDSATNTQEVKE